MQAGEHDLARRSLDQASALTPNDSETLAFRSISLTYLADFEAAVEAAEQGLRVNPYSPDLYLDAISTVHFFQGRYEDCLNYGAQIGDQHPENAAWNAACHAYLGNQDAAQREVEKFLRNYSELWACNPAAGPADYIQWILNVSNPFARDEDRESLAEGFRLAGLPT